MTRPNLMESVRTLTGTILGLVGVLTVVVTTVGWVKKVDITIQAHAEELVKTQQEIDQLCKSADQLPLIQQELAYMRLAQKAEEEKLDQIQQLLLRRLR